MHFRSSDEAISTVFGLPAAAFAGLLYQLNRAWILALTVVFAFPSLFLVQNQSKNERRLDNRHTVFPNPIGGGS